MISVDNFKNNFIRLFNYLPFNIGTALKYTIIKIFNIIVLISVKLIFFFNYLLSLLGASERLNNLPAKPGDSFKTIYNKNYRELIEIILENNFKIFHLNNVLCLNVNSKNEIGKLLLILKRDKLLWIEIDSEYGRYNYRLCLIPSPLIYILLMSSNSFVLYKRYISPDGRVLFGSESGCRIEDWINSEIHYKDKENYKRTVFRVASSDWIKEKNLIIEKETSNKLDFIPYKNDYPIDIVFTWVDSNDNEWRNNFNSTLKEYGRNDLLGTSANESRFRSFNELKYSLRSISMYADFFRKIYIVTAGQVPDWLDTNNNKIEIINHKDIFPKGDYLPTFNSHSIESRLHHIQGLSDNYLYFNDDFFISRPLTPKDFFLRKDISYFFPTNSTYIGLNSANQNDMPVDTAAKNNRDIIFNKFGTVEILKFGHVPYPQIKPILFEIENELKDELDNTSKSRFRNINDISLPSSLYHHYAKHNGNAVPGNINQIYIDISISNSLDLLKKLSNMDVSLQPDVLCINDVDYSKGNIEKYTGIVQNLLERYYPLESEFEK